MCLCIYIYIHIYIHIYNYIDLYAHNMHVSLHIIVCIYIYTHTHTHPKHLFQARVIFKGLGFRGLNSANRVEGVGFQDGLLDSCQTCSRPEPVQKEGEHLRVQV